MVKICDFLSTSNGTMRIKKSSEGADLHFNGDIANGMFTLKYFHLSCLPQICEVTSLQLLQKCAKLICQHKMCAETVAIPKSVQSSLEAWNFYMSSCKG